MHKFIPHKLLHKRRVCIKNDDKIKCSGKFDSSTTIKKNH